MSEHLHDMDDERMQESMRIAELLSRYMQGTITLSERDELEQWKNKSEKNRKLIDELTDEVNIEKAMKWFRERETRHALDETKSKIVFKEQKWTFPLRTLLLAASLVGVIAVTALVFFQLNRRNTLVEQSKAVKASDVAPGGNKATLKLGDGSVITLDNRQAGLVANEKGTIIFNSADG
jgi:transmembrane sensor